jgi:hypothetical protein
MPELRTVKRRSVVVRISVLCESLRYISFKMISRNRDMCHDMIYDIVENMGGKRRTSGNTTGTSHLAHKEMRSSHERKAVEFIRPLGE